MRSNAVLALFLFAVVSFSCASQLGMQYAAATVFRDCSQKALSITNRTEFLPFYAKPADEANIARILGLVANLSTADPASKTSQQTYLACGDYVLTAQNGTLFWRGAELLPPAYMQELENRVAALEKQASQAAYYQAAVEGRVFLLEADALKLRNDFYVFQLLAFATMVLVMVMLGYQVFLHRKQRAGNAGTRHGIRHRIARLVGRKK